MKSPFPGMDPYLEQHWLDVHSRLVIYSCDQMQANLPGDLFARVEERVYVENEAGEGRSINPDVRIVEHGRGGTAVALAEDIAVAEPFLVHLRDEPITETFIEIREVGSANRLITVIEFMSPTNKLAGEGRTLNSKKQDGPKEGKVSLVEIDLTRIGKSAFDVPDHFRAPYHAVVRRWNREDAEIYPISLRQPLPVFCIPLRQTDADIVLNLQPLIDQCYVNGRYSTIDYRRDPEPPMDLADAAWADALLREAGKRT